MPSYGRGGAGNIQAAAQEKERAASDPEAQLSTDEQPLSNPQITSQDNSAYKHTGRGGAGNYYSPSDEASLSTREKETEVAPKPAVNSGKYGRGGAGNIGFATAGKAEYDEAVWLEEQKMKERVAKAVENYVEEGLQVPEKAKLPTT